MKLCIKHVFPLGVHHYSDLGVPGGWVLQGDGCSRGMSVLGDGCLGGCKFLIPYFPILLLSLSLDFCKPFDWGPFDL